VSPRDAGLYLTLLLRPQLDLNVWPLITLAAALAVADALRDTCTLQVDIKWPNDIVLDERKLCGILAETVETPSDLACVVGIGVNLTAESFPAELTQRATSIAAAGKAVDREVLLAALLENLARRDETLRSIDGPAVVISDWTAASSFANDKQVRVDTGSEVFEGTTRGLEADGALRVETFDSGIRIVRAGDVQSLRST
jgi:BirA family biotin operon repressor/biotin-[acetyl-CoA-carboxylase] ligase